MYDLNGPEEQVWNVVTLDLVICTVWLNYVIHLLKVLKERCKLVNSDNRISLLAVASFIG